MNLLSEALVITAREAFSDLEEMPVEERIEVINALKLELHRLSPFCDEPVDCVLWVKGELVEANDYNPNSVAPPEMKLLEKSIGEDGLVEFKNPENPKVHLAALLDLIYYQEQSKKNPMWTAQVTSGAEVKGFLQNHWAQARATFRHRAQVVRSGVQLLTASHGGGAGVSQPDVSGVAVRGASGFHIRA